MGPGVTSFPAPGLGGVCPSVSVAVPSFVVSQWAGRLGGVSMVTWWCLGGALVVETERSLVTANAR